MQNKKAPAEPPKPFIVFFGFPSEPLSAQTFLFRK